MDRVEVGEKFGTMPEQHRFQKRGGSPSPRTFIMVEEAEEGAGYPWRLEKFGEKPRDILKRFKVAEEATQAALKEGWWNNLKMRLGSWLLSKGLNLWLSSRETVTVDNWVFNKGLYLAECQDLWNRRLAEREPRVSQPAQKVLYLTVEEGDNG